MFKLNDKVKIVKSLFSYEGDSIAHLIGRTGEIIDIWDGSETLELPETYVIMFGNGELVETVFPEEIELV